MRPADRGAWKETVLRAPNVVLPWQVEDAHTEARALRMWDTWDMPHRQWVLSAVRALNPQSVYEVGCGSGPNLRLLQAHTTVRLGGSEPFAPYARWAQEHLSVPIDEAALPDRVPVGWDCVVSCYALAYCEPSAVTVSLKGLREAGTKSLVLLEPVGGLFGTAVGYQPFPSGGGGLTCPGWAHDYGRLLPECGWHVGWLWPVMPPVDGINAACVAFPS